MDSYIEPNKAVVSVIVPVYNVKEYLDECIKSVIHQSFKNIEIIIVNDGSSDGSKDVCDKYTNDSRVKVIHKENGGLSSARNVGIQMAGGKYLLFIDSDDYIHPEMIETLVNGIIKDKSDIAVCEYTIDEKMLGFTKRPDNSKNISSEEAIRLMLRQKVFTHVAVCKLFSRELFSDIRFPVGKLYEDYAVMYKVFGKTSRVTLIERKLYYYRQREGSIQKKVTKKNFSDELEYALECKEYIDREYPTLKVEAIGRLVSSCFHILFGAYDKKRDIVEYDQVIHIIKKYRIKCIFSCKIGIKVKIGCIISYMGFDFANKIYDMIGIRGKIVS